MKKIDSNDLYTLKEARLATLISIISIILSVGLYVAYLIFSSNYLSILFVLISVIVSFPLSIIIHELGHLVFGLISGYSFIHFQFLIFMFEKTDANRIRFRIVFTPLLGQCLMGVKDEKRKTIKFESYLMGGSTFNLLMVILTITLISLLYGSKGIFLYYLIPLFYINLYMFISNGIPLNLNGIYNDALNVRLMKKYPEAKDTLINTLSLEYLHSMDTPMYMISHELLNNNYIEEDLDFVHSYVFSFYRTMRRVINEEEDPFKEIIKWYHHEYSLPLIYVNQNYELLAFKRLIDNEEFEYIFKLKINEKMFKTEESDISKLDNILYKYRKNVITKDEALKMLNKLEDLTYENGYHEIDIEFYKALRLLAYKYLIGEYPKIIDEINEENQSEINGEDNNSLL